MACLLLMSIGGMTTSVLAAPDEGGRVPYRYSLDNINGYTTSGDMIGMIRDLKLGRGEAITATGWLATDEGVSHYEYLWLPAGGGAAEWQRVTDAEILARPDLTKAGTPHASGHKTAGFRLTIQPPAEQEDGMYDVYLRGVDGMGNTCDLVVLLNLCYGEPDLDDGSSLLLSFSRIQREGETSVAGNATVTAAGTAAGITLSEEGRVRLGQFNLAVFEQMRITYTCTGAAEGLGTGRRPILGLKSAGTHGYGQGGSAYNMTDSLVYAAIESTATGGVLEVDLSACDYAGDVWLTGYLGSDVTITAVELIYNGYVSQRVAAKIRFSEDLLSYFSSYNYSTATGVTDPVLGDVLRMETTDETNDPFIFFSAGKLLKDHGIVLDADEYKYMVVLYRAEPTNRRSNTTFYLCAGAITGATEACTHTFNIQKDGKWHYYLMDLSQKDTWTGLINGWRFDFLSGDSATGDAVEFATVQFFRTREAATAAAGRDPGEQEAFTRGEEAILRDMSEEQDSADHAFPVDPEDAYVVTEAETEPPAEPSPTPTETPAPGTDASTEAPDTTETPAAPCGASLAALPALLTVSMGAVLLRGRRGNRRGQGRRGYRRGCGRRKA